MVVRRLSINAAGDLAIRLSNGYQLDVWVNDQGWMLLTPAITPAFEVRSSGVVGPYWIKQDPPLD